MKTTTTVELVCRYDPLLKEAKAIREAVLLLAAKGAPLSEPMVRARGGWQMHGTPIALRDAEVVRIDSKAAKLKGGPYLITPDNDAQLVVSFRVVADPEIEDSEPAARGAFIGLDEPDEEVTE